MGITGGDGDRALIAGPGSAPRLMTDPLPVTVMIIAPQLSGCSGAVCVYFVWIGIQHCEKDLVLDSPNEFLADP